MGLKLNGFWKLSDFSKATFETLIFSRFRWHGWIILYHLNMIFRGEGAKNDQTCKLHIGSFPFAKGWGWLIGCFDSFTWFHPLGGFHKVWFPAFFYKTKNGWLLYQTQPRLLLLISIPKASCIETSRNRGRRKPASNRRNRLFWFGLEPSKSRMRFFFGTHAIWLKHFNYP